ncbi:MAG: GNAT family N-acetyltransferase, partial [SAR324 cluster bacterium]|nr:GNAT family N-acetyltransferase [SAR324 cluster bacterium]
KKSITLDEHKVWFKKKLNNENTLMWVFEIENIPGGMVRLEKEDNEIILNYLIAPESRGRGLASKMLKMAMIELNNY